MGSGNSSHNFKNEVLENKLSSAISLILQDTNINELSTNTSSKLFKENNCFDLIQFLYERRNAL